MLVAGIIGVAVSAISLLTIYDFSKASKRGGQLVLNKPSSSKDKVEDGKTKGLSKDYAFQWSYGKEETWTLLIPGAMGYGTHVAKNAEDQFVYPKLSENSNTATFFEEDLMVPGDQAANYAFQQSTSMYWGDQPFTDGPVYLGAIICLLFLLGMFMLKSDHKWWILAISILSILLAWGDHLPGFNYWVFDNVPLYNKFRTPTMILIIPQILWALMGAMLIHQLTSQPINESDKKNFQRGLIAAGVLIGLGYFTYLSNDYSKENKTRTKEFNALFAKNDPDVQRKLSAEGSGMEAKIDNQLYESIAMSLQGNAGALEKSKGFVNAIREDRKELFKDSMVRSFLFMLIAGLVLFFFVQKKINSRLMMGAIIALVAIDLITIGGNYLNKYNFDSKEDFENAEFPMSDADRTILDDKDPNFRVFNVITRGSDEAKTSYYHKTIGGYHPAKLAIYDDLMSYQINRGNMSVLNMLNAKYFISQIDNNPPIANRNPDALGNVWLVKGTKTVKGPAEEMLALNNFNPRDTAIIDQSFTKEIEGMGAADSSDMIRMTRFDNDTIHYQSSTKGNRLAVFSEIYYKDWQAYIDGKPVPIVKANYVLRALLVPAGSHEIIFKFEPKVFFLGKQISNIASWLVFLLLIGGIVWEFNKKKSESA